MVIGPFANCNTCEAICKVINLYVTLPTRFVIAKKISKWKMIGSFHQID